MTIKHYLLNTLLSFSLALTTVSQANDMDVELSAQGYYNVVGITNDAFCSPDLSQPFYARDNYRTLCEPCPRCATPVICEDMYLGTDYIWNGAGYHQHFDQEKAQYQSIYLFNPTMKTKPGNQCSGSIRETTRLQKDARHLLSIEVPADFVGPSRGPKVRFYAHANVPAGKAVTFTLYEQYFTESTWRAVKSYRLNGNNTYRVVEINHQAGQRAEAWYKVIMTENSTSTHASTIINFKSFELGGEKCVRTGGGCLAF